MTPRSYYQPTLEVCTLDVFSIQTEMLAERDGHPLRHVKIDVERKPYSVYNFCYKVGVANGYHSSLLYQ